MKSVIVLCIFGVAAVYAAGDSEATVVRESYDANPEDGSYKYDFETSNGIKAQEAGRQIQIGEEKGSAADGSFSYTAPDGTVISLSYTADDNGFQPSGSHLPTPPPVPDYVVKLLADLAKSKKA